MLLGETVVFLSCMDGVHNQLAVPIRDGLRDRGYRAVVVTDEPMLPGTFGNEEKVSSYLDASDAFVALCTLDPRLGQATAQNIVDEIARARSRPGLRDLVAVFKEPEVVLQTNFAPTWERLDRRDPHGALVVIVRQLATWGIAPTQPVPTQSGPAPVAAEELARLFEGVSLGEPDKAERKLLAHLTGTPKRDQGHLRLSGDLVHLMTSHWAFPNALRVWAHSDAARRASSAPSRLLQFSDLRRLCRRVQRPTWLRSRPYGPLDLIPIGAERQTKLIGKLDHLQTASFGPQLHGEVAGH